MELADLRKWATLQLSLCLGLDEEAKTMAEYLLSIDNRADLETYLGDILDSSNQIHSRFKSDMLARRNFGRFGEGYRKEKKRKLWHEEDTRISQIHPAVKDQKKKKKPVLSVEEAKAIEAKKRPRAKCECMATKHELVNNCLSCGRVVCAMEGGGECLFCGNMVYSRREIEGLSGSALHEYHRQLRGEAQLEQFASHEAHLAKLLDYDKTFAKRTRVYDDETDYFNMDDPRWLDKDERDALQRAEAKARKERHGSRLDKKLVYDFMGGNVREADVKYEDLQQIADQIKEQVAIRKAREQPLKDQNESTGTRSAIGEEIRPQFVPSRNPKSDEMQQVVDSAWSRMESLRIVQDEDYQHLRDDGQCLSMHQPYASLLVAGIKRHEGRTWNSSHRGRLWIHAAAKQPEPQHIGEIEQFYRAFYDDDSIIFPETYPTSCLLGCVEVDDVMDQEAYRGRFPNGESESPFVFVCSGFHECKLKLAMQGDHKIFKLSSHIHAAARKMIT